MTTHFYTATSLDGFIATPEHSLDWLLSQDIDEHGPMHYGGFITGIGALAMGASTYEWLLRNDPAGWSYDMPAWVFTHRELPVLDGADIRFVSGDVTPVHAQMQAAAGGKDLWIVGGGELVGQFADAGLLDEVWLQYAPVTLGAGAPLLPRRLDLELIEVARNRSFLCGRYRVVKAP
ncbi:dihydrofolate reductase family protein [Microbacterium sp. NIBRBAC000506063]|uniref:dihydrofolate reductase family protein n=1 Tax=Microbacterium sp. NIBRBAC000506063 TaxID=2734618 RepID=UPI001BB7851B|nr:dihydrofolate reductase family protein [Microbacterium sp. NIBRBAC000506063]QTV79574.1 dihydrofolate reductase [Microbacterium sp. NIBRBAC000506063]